MKKKSVLMVVSRYPATYGHTTVINNLCIGLNKIGYTTAIGAFSFDSEPPNNITKVKLSRFNLIRYGVNNLNFDIIHTHQALVNYYLLFVKPTIPIVQHYHAASSKLQEINLKIMMCLYKNRISKIICVSQKALNHLRELVGKIDGVVIYNGVDTQFYNPGLPPKYKKGSPQLLFVSVLRKYKKTGVLIDAMTELLKIYPGAHLQIVGDGEDFMDMKNKIREMDLENNVEMVGKISDEDLKLRYSSCDVYVSASSHEHCPVPPFEAMGCGKPLVLSDLEGHNEILNLSKAGLSFTDKTDFCKKIEDVFENRIKFGTNALSCAKEYDWSKICSKVSLIYEELV
mgnify:CR=1 FL=1